MRAALITLLMASFCSAGEKKPPRVLSDEEKHNAYDLAVKRIYSELKAPSTAHWSSFEEAAIKPTIFNQISVEIQTDAQNSFGAMLRNSWHCTVNGPNKKGLYRVLCFERAR